MSCDGKVFVQGVEGFLKTKKTILRKRTSTVNLKYIEYNQFLFISNDKKSLIKDVE